MQADLVIDDPATIARRQRAVGIAMLIAASVLWSISGLVVKVVQIDSIAFAFWRSAGAAAAMLALVPFGSGRLPRWNWMAGSVLLYTAVVTLLITAMTRSTAAAGILLQYTGPLFCALFAWLFLKRRISLRTMLALFVGVGGIAIMVTASESDALVLSIGIASGVAFGGLILLLQLIESRGSINTFAVIFLNNLGCAVLLLQYVVARRHNVAGSEGCGGPGDWRDSAGAAYVLFQLALRRGGAVEASLLILLEPVLNPIWVWLAVGERPDAATFVGGAAILTAMVLEATNPLKKRK